MSLTKRLVPGARRMTAAFFVAALLLALLVAAPAGGAAPAGAVPAGLSAADWAAIRAQLPAPAAPVQSGYLKASSTGAEDLFGYAVAVDGDTVVVSAPSEDGNGTGGPADNSAAGAGAAYVFVRSGAMWSQQAYLKASNAAPSDSFGVSVALDGDTIVVGAHSEDGNGTGGPSDNSASDAGAAYVFVRSGATWTEQAYLKASNAQAFDNFGVSLAVDEDAAGGPTVVVGAFQEDSNGAGGPADNSASNAGAAYVFVRSGATWSQQAYLKASNAGAGDNFGVSVAISGNAADGDIVVVGAYGEDSNGAGGPSDNSASNAGAAYVFVRSGATWTEQAYLKASNAGYADFFGASVAVDEDAAGGPTVVAGAYGEDSNGAGGPSDNSALDAGAAYVLVRSGATWSEQAYLKASNAGAGDTFGYAVAISGDAADGDTIVIGAFSEASNGAGGPTDNSQGSAGAVYVFAGSGATWSEQAYLKASNAEAGDLFGFAVAVDKDAAGDPTVVVGADGEDSNGTGGPADNSAPYAGAAYVFETPPTTGDIVIVKQATPADDTPFAFTEDIPGAGSGFTLSDPGDTTETFDDVAPGSYTVTETGEAGWTLDSLVCVDPDDGSSTGGATATIDLDAGETVTCTFGNSRDTGTITIVKEATPADDTVFTFTEDIPGAANGFTLSDPSDDTETFSEVPLGNYQVSESVPAGWSLDGISCTDPDGGSSTDASTATIDLDLNETVTCTFSNSQLPSAAAGVYVSAASAGQTGDGLAFGPHDVLLWDGSGWTKWFDGTAANLTPTGKAMHDINALWIPDTGAADVVLAFAQNARAVPGIPGKVDGMDLVWWNGSAFSLWFDGQDVGLTQLTNEKIDALHVLDGSLAPPALAAAAGGGCDAYLLISTQANGKVPHYAGGEIKFDGTDVLGFCMTQSGSTTRGKWIRVLNGRAEGMPAQALINLSASDDGQVLYLTTRAAFHADSATGGHSMVYRYDFAGGQFSGPFFSAPAEGLPRPVDGLHIDGELP